MLRGGRLCRGSATASKSLHLPCLRQSLPPDLTEAADLSLLIYDIYQHSILA